MKYFSCLVTIATLLMTTSARIITDYNVTLGQNITYEQEFANARAIEQAYLDANASATDRTVVIPADVEISSMPIYINNHTDITLRVDGTLYQSKNWVQYPAGINNYDPLLSFSESSFITIEGNGTIDGQGFMWWIREILQKNKHTRPYIIYYSECHDIEISGVLIQNSPYYHIVPDDCWNMYMHDFEIYVDIWGQMELHRLFGSTYKTEINEVGAGISIEMPIFPLNTDGIDIWGRNGTFRNLKITNFDDSVVPKPTNKGYKHVHCTTDILIENCTTVYTVGMSIGSVPPSSNHACVANVTFRNIVMERPIKGIYVKPNPGSLPETGLIQNITYENFVMRTPIWWAIWIGPQQQYQPGWSHDAGCSMFYPFGNCDTYNAVTMDRIILKNITSTGSLLPVGVILCNYTNPCTNFHFENINATSTLWDTLGVGWISQFVEGTAINSYPDPHFKPNGYYSDPANRVPDESNSHLNQFTAEFMLKHLIKNVFALEFGEEFADEQKQLKLEGYRDQILEATG